MKKYLPLFILLLLFFIFKLSNLGIRLSDTNIYFYTGYKILTGRILYKDIFFTNFPLLPYMSSLYFLLTFGNLKLFFLTPTIEVCGVVFLIYKIVYQKHTDKWLALVSSFLYLFSFIILSTSDHQSGVFIASVFSILSYYFYLNKKYLLTGIFIALAILTKAYFLPIATTYIATIIWERELKKSYMFFVGALITGVVAMLPTLLFAFPDFIKDVFVYSLTRSQGIEKSNIAWFFIVHDLPLFCLLIFNIFTVKKNKFFGLLSVFGILFFFFYKDVYFLYLNFLIPFLVLSYPEFYKSVEKNLSPQKFIVPTVLAGFLIFSFATYLTGFRNLQLVNNMSQITEAVKKENPRFLYGVNDATPALSYLSGVPLLNGIIDTNTNIYRKGFLNSRKMMSDARHQKTLLITHGLDYPEAGIRQDVTDEIFDMTQIKKSCKLVGSFAVQTESPENRLNLLRCY